jgi:glycosyltransferase involved in cell wall biosynthesis
MGKGLLSKGKIERRILHIVESLGKKAIETWLLRILTAAVELHPEVKWSVFCSEGRAEALDRQYRDIGVEVFHSRYAISDRVRFVSGLRSHLKRGRYDTIHCHHDVMSAAYLIAALGLRIPRRIVHIHNTGMHLPTPSRIKHWLFLEPMRQICLRQATHLVGISTEALDSMLAGRAPRDDRDRVVYYGLETGHFHRPPPDALEFRRSLVLRDDAKVLLFAGRMVDYKNPFFVVEMLEKLRQETPMVAAIFAGAGPLEGAVVELAKSKGLEDRVRILGWRDDLPLLMQGCDLLVWPGLETPKEGLGLGVVEAQAAGLPILMSRSVPRDAIVMPPMVDILPLSAGPDAWAGRAQEILSRPRIGHGEALRQVEMSPFSLENGVRSVMALYAL